MRRLLKFLHTLGAAGLMGGLAALGLMVVLAPASIGAGGYGPLTEAMARIASWIVGPSMVVTVIAGLLAIAITPAFHEAAWVWAKAATGILILEGCLHVMGPVGDAAKRGAAAGLGGASAGVVGAGAVSAGGAAPLSAAHLLAGEAATLWVLLAVCAANIALAIWKPRMPRLPV